MHSYHRYIYQTMAQFHVPFAHYNSEILTPMRFYTKHILFESAIIVIPAKRRKWSLSPLLRNVCITFISADLRQTDVEPFWATVEELRPLETCSPVTGTGRYSTQQRQVHNRGYKCSNAHLSGPIMVADGIDTISRSDKWQRRCCDLTNSLNRTTVRTHVRRRI